MNQISMPKGWQGNIISTSNYCQLHTYIKDGLEHIKRIPMLLFEGKEYCPRCGVEEMNKEFEASVQEQCFLSLSSKNGNVMLKKSILTDQTILKATFNTFLTNIPEEVRNKNTCLEILSRLRDGEVMNVLLQGNQGAGKSHLAYSMLRELNRLDKDVMCLFICLDEMLRLIRDSYSNKESKYTEQYFVDLLSSVDYLVLDDLGAETGAMGTSKTATDFVQRVLYAVSNARQNKVTIITSNLNSENLFAIYDKKLVSRLLKKVVHVPFKETKDKRILGVHPV